MATDFFPISDEPKALVLSLDFDGCLDTPLSRTAFINWLIHHLQSNPEYDTVVVCIGSARQSVPLDLRNSSDHFITRGRSNSSSTTLGTEFTTQLESTLADELCEKAPTVLFNPLVSSDIHYNLEAGTTFGAMVQAHQAIRSTDDFNSPHAFTVTDRTGTSVELTHLKEGKMFVRGDHYRLTDPQKTLFPYMFSHDIACQRLGKPFTLLSVDDRMDILCNQTHFFSQYPQLLPRSCAFQTLQWDNVKTGTDTPYMSGVIQGTGDTDVRYATTLATIGKTLPRSPSPEDVNNAVIDHFELPLPATQLVPIQPLPSSPGILAILLYLGTFGSATMQEWSVGSFFRKRPLSTLVKEGLRSLMCMLPSTSTPTSAFHPSGSNLSRHSHFRTKTMDAGPPCKDDQLYQKGPRGVYHG